MTKYLIISISISVALLFASIKSCKNIKEDRDRLANNQNSMFEQTRYYRTKDSLSAASVQRLTLSKNELKQYCKQLTENCNQLNIKIKQIQSASSSATETKYQINTIIRDSIVIRDNLTRDTIKHIAYKNNWLSFVGSTSDNVNFNVNIESRDTLTTIVYRVPRKFLFLRWGCKAIRQDIISKNPYSKIVYNEYIEMKK